MKNIIKKGLKSFGLFDFAKKILQNGRKRKKLNALKKYAHVERWPFNYGGIQLVFNTQDSYSKAWFFPRYDYGKIHEPIATRLFIENIGPESVVLDIGAHLGYFTCVSGKLAHRGSVHAFEVDPKCIPLLQGNVSINNLTNCTINNCAVSDHSGVEKIPVFKSPNPGLVINSVSSSFLEIPAIRIDDYTSKRQLLPDFIKIDVEGAEWKVLNGMHRILQQPNIKLLIEIHVDKLQQHFHIDYKTILAFLDDQHFLLNKINSHRSDASNIERISRDSNLTGNTMLFCTKSGIA